MNINKIKNYIALFLASFLPIISFLLVLILTGSFFVSIIFTTTIIFVTFIIARRITWHPLRDLIEGQGILILKVDSSGIIKPFIARVLQPFVYHSNKQSLFDRKLFFYFKNPQNATLTEEKEKLVLEVPKRQHYFVFEQYYPTLIWNEQMNTFIDKDFLSKAEDTYIVTHNLNYIKVKTEELSAILRDFARYVVELTKPKPMFGFLGNWIFWIVLIVILALLFLTVPNFLPNLVKPTVTPQPQPQIITPVS